MGLLGVRVARHSRSSTPERDYSLVYLEVYFKFPDLLPYYDVRLMARVFPGSLGETMLLYIKIASRAVSQSTMTDQLDGHWLNFSSLDIGRQHGYSAKRPHVSSSLSRYRANELLGERHDGRSIPRRLYGYRLHGKTLEPASHKRASHMTRRIQQHLRVASSQLDGSYKSMVPFSSSIASVAPPDTAVQVEHGLVYRVLRLGRGTIHSSLLYTFYTPLDFLEHPQSVSDIAWGIPADDDVIIIGLIGCTWLQ